MYNLTKWELNMYCFINVPGHPVLGIKIPFIHYSYKWTL